MVILIILMILTILTMQKLIIKRLTSQVACRVATAPVVNWRMHGESNLLPSCHQNSRSLLLLVNFSNMVNWISSELLIIFLAT